MRTSAGFIHIKDRTTRGSFTDATDWFTMVQSRLVLVVPSRVGGRLEITHDDACDDPTFLPSSRADKAHDKVSIADDALHRSNDAPADKSFLL